MDLSSFSAKSLKRLMTLQFESKVTDFDCVNITPTLLLLTVIEDGRLKSYSLNPSE